MPPELFNLFEFVSSLYAYPLFRQSLIRWKLSDNFQWANFLFFIFCCWKRRKRNEKGVPRCYDAIECNSFAPLGKETRKQNLLRLRFMGVRWLSQIGTCPFSRAWSRTSIRSKRETGFLSFFFSLAKLQSLFCSLFFLSPPPPSSANLWW